jgi:hypothetical protein
MFFSKIFRPRIGRLKYQAPERRPGRIAPAQDTSDVITEPRRRKVETWRLIVGQRGLIASTWP